MTDPHTGQRANDFDLKALRRLDKSRADILAGDATPAMSDRMCGLPPLADNPIADLRRVATIEIDTGRYKGRVLAGLQRLVDAPSAVAAVRVATILDRNSDDLRYAFLWLAALLGHQQATDTVVSTTMRGVDLRRTPIQNTRHLALAIGLASRWPHTEPTDFPYKPGHLESLVDHGLHVLREAGRAIQTYDDAQAQLEQSIADPDSVSPEQTAEIAAVEDLLRATLEDRAELSTASLLRQAQPIDLDAMVVVPKLQADKMTGWRKDIAKSWSQFAGVAMPLVLRGDVAKHSRALASRWPHAAEIINTVMGDLAARESICLRPTLIVGPPGSGKSALARAIAVELRLPCELVSLGGSADSSLMGTSAQWSTTRESLPLQLIKRTGLANPLVIWDEVEKASPERRNGSALDALLGFLEVDQARQYRDPCLEIEVDLSAVSHIATANDLDTVPPPLRDRMRILTMPAPGWQHLGVLTRQVLDRLASERGIDPRWMAGLAEDEMQLVRDAWPGGSLRQLSRIVAVIVDGRDQILGRA